MASGKDRTLALQKLGLLGLSQEDCIDQLLDLVRERRESEEFHVAILDTLNEGVVLHGADGTILEWNPAAARLLGLSDDEMSGRSSIDPQWRTLHDDGTTWPASEHPSMTCLRTGEPTATEAMGLHHPDGTLIWLQVACEPIRDPHGERRVLTTFADITAKRALDAAVSATEEASRTSLDALDQGVVLFGPDGTIRRSNPAATRILRESAEDLLDRMASGRWQLLDHHGDRLPLREGPVHRALRGQASSGEVVGWERPDGSCVQLRMSCVPDADGRGSMLLTFIDVTEEHRALQDVARFQHFFEHSNDMITLIGKNGEVKYSSPSRTRVLGYPEGFDHADGILGLIHPDDMAAAAAELAQLIDGERGPEPFLVRVRAYDGTWRHVETVGTNLLHEPAVRGIVLTTRDATDRVLLTEQLAHLAHHDPLTDLPNRSVLESSLRRSLTRSAAERARVGVCFIDLDRFKQVNDLYGHAAGDAVIVEVADRIRSVVRGGDTAVRIGGDEFVVILDRVNDADAAAAAACRIRDAITVPPIVVGTHEVGASIGVAVSEPYESPASLLLRADASLYEAKTTRSSAVALAST